MSKEQLAADMLKNALEYKVNGNPTFRDSEFTPSQLMALIVNSDLVSEIAKKHNFSEGHSTELFTALSYLLASDWIKNIIK